METKRWEVELKMTKDIESGKKKLASISPWRTEKEKQGRGGGSVVETETVGDGQSAGSDKKGEEEERTSVRNG